MTGRNFKNLEIIWRTIFAVMVNGLQIPLFKIKIKCPDCGSSMIGTNGTKKNGSNRVECFICKNPACLKERSKRKRKKGRQFIVTTSFEYKKLINSKLKELYYDLLKDGAKNKTIAKKYGVSPSQISALRTEIETAIEKHQTLDSLVNIPQPDRAIAIDETFLEIEGKPIYIIIATGYESHKTLGIKVSPTRKEKDMREVFDEAERNTKYPIAIVTSDAWGSTIAMVKNLGREIIHVIHKHKKPFDKAVINLHEYTDTERITTDIGVKTDFTKKRGKREGYHMTTITPLNPPPSKKRGRPKGSKNKRKRNPPKKNVKQGKRGVFKVFDKGKRFYAKIDPYRKTVKISKNLPASLAAALTEVLNLFALLSIQNNLSENKNSILHSKMRLRGPKTVKSVERRIRATEIVQNRLEILEEIQISRNVRGSFYMNNLKVLELPNIQNWVISM